MKLKLVSLSIMMMGASTLAVASGYHFGTQSVSAQSTANASAAEASNASTIFYNAAGMTKLEGTNFSGALNLVAPSVEYSNAKGFYPPNPGNGSSISPTPAGAISGASSGKITDDLIAVPQMYLTHQLNDKATVGLGVYVPFASETEYQRNSVLRYNLNATSLKTIDFNPTLALKLNNNHAVAFGLVAQHAEATLRQYANFGARIPAGTPPAMAANGAVDGYADVEGDDWGFGFNLAWMWDVNENTTVGANYRSAVKHSLTGNAKWSISENAKAIPVAAGVSFYDALRAAGYAADESAKVDIKTPESLSVHFMHKANPKTKVFGDVTWTRHSQFNTANLVYGNSKPGAGGAATNVTVLTPNWRDTYKLALGMAYQTSDQLELRGGVAYDKTPVPSDDKRLATMPDNDRYWFSVGANYQLSKMSSLDLAYSYIHIKDGKANVNGYCGGSVPGAVNCVSSYTNGTADYKASAQIVGVQYNHRF